ncbi:MAG: DNA-processing protein DprA [Gammaproteobacteria bacterium]|nr:DNA-processing protein DprA [Gammaproteobacteria bacterium]
MEELESRVRLSRLYGYDTGPLAESLAAFPSAATALAEVQRRQLVPLAAEPLERLVEADLAWLRAGPGRGILALCDDAYPQLLRSIADPPPLLYYLGDPEVLCQVQMAVVGSRNPTPGGRETATAFSRYLARNGLVITSGLARGIDTAAHRGALAASGYTVAVLGTGVDRVYPAENRELARRIADTGVVVSEFPLGTSPRAGHFPRRNRIISGLAVGTLVVEAAARSGSLITARLAAEQGREVFAIPGSIQNPMARGCHELIRQGAKLVETAAHILEELPPLLDVALPARGFAPASPPSAPESLAEDYVALLEAMGYDPVSVDQLVQRTGLTANVLSSMLLLLELEGHIGPVAGGLYMRISNEGTP